MIIKCDQCQSKFKLDDSKISESGAKVRCSKCKHIFTVVKESATPPVEEPATPPVEEPAAPPVEDAPTGTDLPESEDTFGMEDDLLGDFEEGAKEEASDAEEDLSWGNLAGDMDGMDIAFEGDEEGEPAEEAGNFGLEGEEETAGFGLEGEEESAGFGIEGEEESGEFGLEGEDESGGFGLESEDESGGFGLESEEETAGFGIEGEEESGGFGLEGEEESGRFGLEGEEESGGFGLEGEEESGGFGLEGEEESGGFGLEGEEETAGFGIEGEEESGGFGLEGEEESGGFGLEGEEETAGFGIEGEEESGGFGLEGEEESVETSEEQPADDFGGLDLDTGPDEEESAEDSFTPPPPEYGEEEGFEGENGFSAKTETPVETKKSSSSMLMLLLFLLLILGGGYYIATSGKNVVIAGFDIGQFLRDTAGSLGISSQPKPSEKIEITDLNGYYLQTDKDGLIFVIEGFAVNNFSGPRSFIAIKGNIYDGTGKLVMEQNAYCGNTFSKDELAQLSRKKVTDELKSRLGKGLINSNIEPGKRVPFMLVFYSTPDTLAEFNVEVTGSENAMQNVE